MILLGSLVASAAPRGLRRQDTARPHTTQTTQQQNGFRQQLNQFIRQNQLKCFTKQGKQYVGIKNNTNMDNYLKMGQKNVVEFFVRPGFHHLYTRVPKPGADGKMEQHVYSRISGLSRSKWYGGSGERVSVLCQLSDKEMSNLNKFLDSAVANPSQVIGKFVYAGGRPPRASNCTDYITTAKIGERGESLARVLGVWESGMPQSFLRSLMRSGNDRVKAIVVQNPNGEFNERYDLNHSLR